MPNTTLDGVLLIHDIAKLLRMSEQSVRNQLKAGTFPIPPMARIDRRHRWWGPTVRAWMDRQEETPNGRPEVLHRGTRPGKTRHAASDV